MLVQIRLVLTSLQADGLQTATARVSLSGAGGNLLSVVLQQGQVYNKIREKKIRKRKSNFLMVAK